jgi:beta-glucanase (GH16 family)
MGHAKTNYFHMYRNISILAFLFFLPVLSHTQTLEDDFEGNGNIFTWFGDDCAINRTFANPYKQSINSSATVLRYMDNGGQYANLRFDADANFNLSVSATFTIKIYVPSSGLTGNQPNQVSLKLQDGKLGQPWITQSEVIKPIVLNQWQTVKFNFKSDTYVNLDSGSLPPSQRKDFNRVVIQVNGENNNNRVLAFIDDFFYNGIIPSEPVFDRLVWSDEFDKNGAVDNAKWHHQTKLPNDGSWYNGEIQHYTNRTSNAFTENGFLKIVAKKETFTDQGRTKAYTSARLNSKFTFKYGKVEIRAKLPSGVGTWPALWMLGKNINEVGGYWDNQGFGTTAWPACGEIDIMEHWGNNQNYVQSAIHTPSSFGNTVNLGGRIIPTVSTDFHVYGLVWTPEKLVFSVDDTVHYIYNPSEQDVSTWPFDAEQYILMNIAILPGISSGFTQSAMEVDYVRVYQESPPSATQDETRRQHSYYPNPVDDELKILIDSPCEKEIKVYLYAFDGTLIKTYYVPAIINTLTVNHLGSLPTGMYMVSYKINQSYNRIKFIKK